MHRKFLVVVFVALVLGTAAAIVQQDLSQAQIEVTKVAGTVYMIHGSDDATLFTGGNIGISTGSDGVLMIDTKMQPVAAKVKAAIAGLAGNKEPKFILNTHVHGDHVGGNATFSESGTVIAHNNVRKRILGDLAEDSWPVITFEESLAFYMNGEEIKAMHYPTGHTDGDAVVFFANSNVIHMGDHFFNGMFPFVDLSSGGNVQGYMDNIKEVIGQAGADVKIIPGHGPLASLQDLKTAHRMMVETTELVRSKMSAGKSLDAMQQEGLQEEWKSWSWSFISTERWIETIYNSYSE